MEKLDPVKFFGAVPLAVPAPNPPGVAVEDDPKVGVEENDPKVEPNVDVPSELLLGAGDVKLDGAVLVPDPTPGPNKPAPLLTLGAARLGDPKVG